MRRLVLMGAVVVALATGAVAVAAIHVSVSPGEGTEKTKFTVSFAVDRKVSGDRWLTVQVLSSVSKGDCEHEESAAVTFAPMGLRVDVVLRPIDKLRWCPGVYRGIVRFDRRIGCGRPGLDIGPCSLVGPTVARFSFSVTP